MSKLSDTFKGVFKAASILGVILMVGLALFLAASNVPPGQGNDNIGGEEVNMEGLGDLNIKKLNESGHSELEYQLSGAYEEVNIDVYIYYFRNIRKINGDNSEVVENESENLFLDYQVERNVTLTSENPKLEFSTDNKKALFAGVQVEVKSFETNDDLNSKFKRIFLIIFIITISSILSYCYLDRKNLYRED